jgi:TolB-like protein/DNA-binding winged helix-turn-helix (wHTH) protein
VLQALLERPQEVVTREELRQRLWPENTFVDYDLALKKAVNRLREVLGDSAESPRFIETVPRRGYRFIGTIAAALPTPPDSGGQSKEAPERPVAVTAATKKFPWKLVASLAMTGVAALLLWSNADKLRTRIFATSGPLEIHSIAVLPLQNLSKEPEQEFFVDGMTDELITDLAKIGELRVISHTSVMPYKGTQKSLGAIAHELNVDAIVEGTVLRSGNRVRVTAQLLRAVPRSIFGRIATRET